MKRLTFFILPLFVLSLIMPVFAQPPAFVTGISAYYNNAAGGFVTSGAITVTSGDTIIVFATNINGQNPGASMAITDSQGNTYTAEGSPGVSLDSGELTQAFGAIASATGSDTITLTLTVVGGSSHFGFQAADYGITNGVGGTAAID